MSLATLFTKTAFLEDCCFQPICGSLLERKVRDSCRAVGQVRPRRCVTPRRLTAHPAESEHPEAEINTAVHAFILSNKVCEQSLCIRREL